MKSDLQFVSSKRWGKSRYMMEYAKAMLESNSPIGVRYYMGPSQYEYFTKYLGEEFVKEHCILVDVQEEYPIEQKAKELNKENK